MNFKSIFKRQNNQKFTILTFKVSGLSIPINIKIDSFGNVLVPLFKSFNNEETNMHVMVPKAEFIADIKKLLPEFIDDNFTKNTFEALFNELQNHINKYGRLLAADMELYISESILIMCGISKGLKIKEPDSIEKQELFSMLSFQIMNELYDN